ncbi:sugar isomerase domain-containing protein, partial [Rhizobium sp. 60-20]
MTAVTDSYFTALIGRLETLREALAEPMSQASAAICAAARADRRVYVFGTGHSHMLAEEVHYRAGGLAFTIPVLVGSAMLHEGAVISSVYERTEGLIRPVFERYGMQPGDVLIIASNSGVNAAPIEAADYGREIGAT